MKISFVNLLYKELNQTSLNQWKKYFFYRILKFKYFLSNILRLMKGVAYGFWKS